MRSVRAGVTGEIVRVGQTLGLLGTMVGTGDRTSRKLEAKTSSASKLPPIRKVTPVFSTTDKETRTLASYLDLMGCRDLMEVL